MTDDKKNGFLTGLLPWIFLLPPIAFLFTVSSKSQGDTQLLTRVWRLLPPAWLGGIIVLLGLPAFIIGVWIFLRDHRSRKLNAIGGLVVACISIPLIVWSLKIILAP